MKLRPFGAALLCSAACLASAAPRELAVCSDPSNLPFSNERQEGFENRIARLIADDLNATLRYTWSMQRRSFLRRTLMTGDCDVVMGVPLGLERVAATQPYYTSTYVFVTLRSRGLDLHSFDDPRLKDLKIGLQALGAEGANTPPAAALARRGIQQQVVGYPMWGDEDEESPQARIIEAVAHGDIDTAIVWGPFAGYFAKRFGNRLTLAPVDADPQQPGLAFAYAMALGVRKADAELRATLQGVLERRHADIEKILNDYGIPVVAPESARPAGE